jgi:NAD kinase
VPLSPHTLAARPLVTASSDVVELLPQTRERQALLMFVDGQRIASTTEHGDVTSAIVTPRSDELILLRYGVPDFYTSTSKAFFGAGYAR